MKTNSKLKLGIGAVIAAFFAIMPTSAFATVKAGSTTLVNGSNLNGTIKYDDSTKVITLNGYSGALQITGQNATIKTTDAQASKKISTIGIVGTDSVQKPILTIDNEANLVTTGKITATHKASGTIGIVLGSKLCTKDGSKITQQQASSNTVYSLGTTTSGVNISAANCTNGNTPSTPETIDAVYVYVAILVASSAIFAYRRYLAKR